MLCVSAGSGAGSEQPEQGEGVRTRSGSALQDLPPNLLHGRLLRGRTW